MRHLASVRQRISNVLANGPMRPTVLGGLLAERGCKRVDVRTAVSCMLDGGSLELDADLRLCLPETQEGEMAESG